MGHTLSSCGVPTAKLGWLLGKAGGHGQLEGHLCWPSFFSSFGVQDFGSKSKGSETLNPKPQTTRAFTRNRRLDEAACMENQVHTSSSGAESDI